MFPQTPHHLLIFTAPGTIANPFVSTELHTALPLHRVSNATFSHLFPCAYQRTLPALLRRPGLCKRLLTQELATFLGRSPHFYCLLLLLCTHPCRMWGSEDNTVGSLLYLHWNTTASHTTDSTGLVKVESGGHVPAPHFCVTQLRHSFDAVYANLDLSRGSGTAVSQQASSRGYGTPLDSRSGAC